MATRRAGYVPIAGNGSKTPVTKQRNSCLAIVGVVGIWTAAGVLIALLAGGGFQMASMSRGMTDMNGKMTKMVQPADGASAFVQDLKSRFPDDQAEITVRQALQTIENVHHITSRVKYLLSNVEPNQITELMGHVEHLAQKAETWTTHLTEEDIEQFKHQAIGLLEHVNNILGGVQPTQVDAAMQNLNRIAGQLDVGKINELVENTKGILNLHEIKIQI
jgi:hypothetical protein